MLSFLGAEQLIIDRLLSELTANINVMSIDEISSISDMSQFIPTIYVTYEGIGPLSSSNSGRANVMLQQWSVTTAVKGVNDSRTGENARSVAGPIIDEVLLALLGHKLSPDYYKFKLIEAQGALYDEGFAYFPLIFETQITLVGKQT